MYHGVINVYKEAGFTSHDVVAKLRGICGQKKIGHTGTLDPAAEGVLVVCLGNGTRLCEFLADRDKEYEAVLLLGVSTDTQDTTGQVLDRRAVTVTEEEIRQAVQSFWGEQMQIPPMYSALKVGGKRLYDLARAGQEVERAPRPVTIYEIEILQIALPRVRLRIRCSGGTYIRTLCADIGEKLGCGGTMESLLRTRVGEFSLKDAMKLTGLQKRREDGTLSDCILPVDACFSALPAYHVRPAAQKLLGNGNALRPDDFCESCTCREGEWVRVYGRENRFFGIYAYGEGRSLYKPVKMFLGE